MSQNQEDREALIDLRAMLTRMETMIRDAPADEDLEQIDWAMWRKKIRYPGIVDRVEASFKKVDFPDPQIPESFKAADIRVFKDLVANSKISMAIFISVK